MENKKATFFEFTSYAFEPKNNKAVFNYTTIFNDASEIKFTETILLPNTPNTTAIPEGLIKKILESLHIMLGISYYKFYCATNIKLPYTLSKQEANFWNTAYKKGLGEFFYRNNLNPNISPKFPFSGGIKPTNYQLVTNNSRYLAGIGGGKDSIVATELLLQQGFDVTALHIKTGGGTELIENIVSTLGVENITTERILDKKVFEQHDYNGHIPISAVYAFLGVFSSILYGYQYFVVGNEQSSNFGNKKYKGLEINHQWSKSFEFEKLFSEYVKNILTPDVHYFSLLRSFYEIRVVKLFAKYKKYFPYFSSCNKNFRADNTMDGLWCGECAKCVFVFTLLSAYLSKKELLGIFRKNLYQDEDLLPLFKDVLGFGTMKPFDCVGTFEEAQTALFLAKKKFANDFIVRQMSKEAKYHKEVFRTNKETLVPEQCKFLGMEKALILGYGKEGKITKQYLKKEYPKLKIGVGDGKLDKNYLKKQTDFDIAVKTPGINKELVTVPYTTATNIFLSKVLDKNLVIGITGSKGKSTTSSLIFAILKEAGKNVKLLGNIGDPMLEALLNPISQDQIFVLELSSYQLDDIKFSPDIAVVTNLFPEHMDFHHGVENYYQAKKNIINFQHKDNYFIYNPENALSKKWVKDYQGKAVPCSTDIPLEDTEIPLLGEHNKNNIRAAVSVARILEIPDTIITTAIKNFKGLPHRLERVGEFKGITFYDDAISTTPESTIMAIKALKNIGTIFLGGEDRNYDFSQLEKAIKRAKIRNVVLFPDSGKRILKSTKGLNVLKTKSMQEAVQFAYQHTQKDSICLLSCASPSYSLWKNFEEKGDQFKKEISKQSRI